MSARFNIGLAITLFVPFALFGSFGGAQSAELIYRNLPLINGWETHGEGTGVPAGAVDSENVVHVKGAMEQPAGTIHKPF